ncbi:MAG: oligoendopeptidase F family protein [Anaerolineales bacterium]|nr:MAG: oligoendopeptidase F family protein [Anaerolineales bacterium]
MAEITRSQAPIEATWKRETTFASWQAWDAQFEQAKAGLPELKAWSGRLAVGPAALADWFEVYDRHAVSLGELGGFVGWAVTVDGSDEQANRRQGLFGALDAEFDATVAFALPQMLAVGEQLLDWAQQEPRLAKYRHYLHNLLRLQQNTRSEEVEELLGMVNDPFSLTYRSFSELTNSDLKFADAVDAAGDHHPIFQSSYGSSIQSVDRTRRRSAWESYFDGYLGMQNTLAAMYLGNVKQQEFLRKARGFDSVLEMRLAPTNLPVQVFRNLIDVFTDNLPTWHRYWAVKSKLLGLERMAPYDIWAPILQKVPTVPYAQAVEWICDALRPLGQDYVATMRAGSLQERWVDWAPNKEKRQGAASSRMVGRKPPYIFMSYNDTVFSLSTLAHELGHSMHSHAFARHQPIVYNDYGAISSTVTETASNFQQAMTRAYLRKELAGDANFQLAMVDEAMSNFHRYFFIMPTLARFEEEVYSRAKAGKPLSASIFNGILMEYFAEGYGNTFQDDPARTAVTWAQFLHLYIPFYSFQYAVGISAAHAIAEKVLADQPGAVADYHSFLQAGGSLYAMDLFDLAGVDMSSRAPIEAAFRELEANVAALERLADQ